MDKTSQNLGFIHNINSLNALSYWSKVQQGAGFRGNTLQLDSPAYPNLSSANPRGLKRKWGDFNGVEHPLLILGLGRSPSSSDNSKVSSATACTMSSVKETEEESSMDLGLNFDLCLGNENTYCQKKSPVGTGNVLLASGSKLDLQLSLSTGSPESAVTNVTTASIHLLDGLQTSVNNSVLTMVGKGSESTNWLFGNYVPSSSYAFETTSAFPSPKILPKKVDTTVIASDPSSTMIRNVESPVACTSGITNPQKRTTTVKYCQFPGCVKGARGASGRCIAHGGGRRCQKPGCQKGAEGRTIYCKAHGGGRRCQYLGCTKSAEGCTDYCIAHGGGRRCSQEGCTRAARGKSGLCIRHGGGKRCKKENCTKSAEGYSGLCISHGGGRRCQFPDCTKGAQGSTKYCKAHGGGKRCTHLGCTKGAEGSTPYCKGHGGGKRCSFGGGTCTKSVHGGTQFCVAHGGGKRCAVPGCTKSARGRTDFCVRHGGGKRCKYEGCRKSAQGSTDFCKAHGGGKRCSWGQSGSSLGIGGPPCDKFARSKTGLCAAHSALVQDHCVHGGGTLGLSASQYATTVKPEKMKEPAVEEDMHMKVRSDEGALLGWTSSDEKRAVHPLIPTLPSIASLPEGRVHGGSLIAFLSGSGNQANAGTSENGGAAGAVMHTWM